MNPRRILVVGDEEEVQSHLRRLLLDAGYQVESANDGSVALQMVGLNVPDLVVLDLLMAGTDGWDVLRALRAAPDPPPVLVITALADQGTLVKSAHEGATAYVCKPFRFPDLVATCERVLQERDREAGGSAERRREERRAFLVEATVLSKFGEPMAVGSLTNISIGGARLDLGVALESEDEVRVALPGEPHLPEFRGRVLWREASERGFAHGLRFDLTVGERDRLHELLNLGPATEGQTP